LGRVPGLGAPTPTPALFPSSDSPRSNGSTLEVAQVLGYDVAVRVPTGPLERIRDKMAVIASVSYAIVVRVRAFGAPRRGDNNRGRRVVLGRANAAGL